MKINSLTLVLRTWNMPETMEFYETVLGFERKSYEPDWGWASLTCGDVSLMLSSPNQHEGDAAPAFTGSLYFRVSDIDDLWTQLQDKARVCYPLESFDYGMREFAIYDNNGYLLQFGQAVDDE